MNTIDPSAAKSRMRAAICSARRDMSLNSPGAARIAAANAFREIAPLRSVPAVSAYIPHRDEIDPTPLMHLLQGQEYAVCVPVIEGKGQPLRFRHWAPGKPLTRGRHGVMVPLDGEWLVPEILIVPLLAFDAEGYRLGYGGGYYDRTIQDLRARSNILAIGLAYAEQEVPAVPREPWDMPLDCIATERGVIRRSA